MSSERDAGSHRRTELRDNFGNIDIRVIDIQKVRRNGQEHVGVLALEVQEAVGARGGVDVGRRRHHRVRLGEWSEMEG